VEVRPSHSRRERKILGRLFSQANHTCVDYTEILER